jgi:hypothetical protein
MRIFVYEYACAQAKGANFPKSVRIEGRAMWQTLVEDFGKIRGVEVATLTDCPPDRERAEFRQRARDADWTVVIAPELDDLLLERCRWVLQAGGRLLGSPPDVVKLTGDKWATYRFLRTHGVRTPRTWLAERSAGARGALAGPLIAKPRFGAGSQNTYVLSASTPWPVRGMLVQQFVPGLAASVAFLSPGLHALLPAEQCLSRDGRFRYLGGRVPLAQPLGERAIKLARDAIRHLPEFRGYVGVDLVLGEPNDGRADFIIEINPRLTTSYVGLRALARQNLAKVMLRLACGERAGPLRWLPGAVEFDAYGQCSVVSGE